MLNIFPYLDVLAIDEFPASLRLLEGRLAMAGFAQVEGAKGALMAAQKLSKRSYHIAFVALEMWEIDGLEFLDYMRQESKLQSTLRVAVSDDGSVRRRTSAIKAGADAFLSRPFSPELIRNTLTNLLSSPVARRGLVIPLTSAQGRRGCHRSVPGFYNQ